MWQPILSLTPGLLYRFNCAAFALASAAPTDENLARVWRGPYLDEAVPADPWGNPYRYQFPGSKRPNEPEIISAGPDGILGNEDDLSSQDD